MFMPTYVIAGQRVRCFWDLTSDFAGVFAILAARFVVCCANLLRGNGRELLLFSDCHRLAAPLLCQGYASGSIGVVSAGEVGLAAIGEIQVLHGVFVIRLGGDSSGQMIDAVFDKEGNFFRAVPDRRLW